MIPSNVGCHSRREGWLKRVTWECAWVPVLLESWLCAKERDFSMGCWRIWWFVKFEYVDNYGIFPQSWNLSCRHEWLNMSVVALMAPFPKCFKSMYEFMSGKNVEHTLNIHVEKKSCPFDGNQNGHPYHIDESFITKKLQLCWNFIILRSHYSAWCKRCPSSWAPLIHIVLTYFTI